MRFISRGMAARGEWDQGGRTSASRVAANRSYWAQRHTSISPIFHLKKCVRTGEPQPREITPLRPYRRSKKKNIPPPNSVKPPQQHHIFIFSADGRLPYRPLWAGELGMRVSNLAIAAADENSMWFLNLMKQNEVIIYVKRYVCVFSPLQFRYFCSRSFPLCFFRFRGVVIFKNCHNQSHRFYTFNQQKTIHVSR